MSSPDLVVNTFSCSLCDNGPMSHFMAVAHPNDGVNKKEKVVRGRYNCNKCGQPKRGHTCIAPYGPPLRATAHYNNGAIAADLAADTTAAMLLSMPPTTSSTCSSP